MMGNRLRVATLAVVTAITSYVGIKWLMWAAMLAMIGALCNFTVMRVNDGKMPVAVVLDDSYPEHYVEYKKGKTELWWLGDCLVVGRHHFSIGDCLIWISLAMMTIGVAGLICDWVTNSWNL